MPYRVKGRPTWRADLRTPTGWKKAVALPTTNKALATRIEQMWETLASEHRAWDVLNPVLARPPRLTIGRLYDLWVAARFNLVELRAKLNDTDLSALRESFLIVYDQQVQNEESRKRMRRHLDALLERPLTASEATAEELTARLYAYKGGPNTLRAVHSSWSVFFDYARRIKKVLTVNPMEADVPRPAPHKPPPEFYELDAIERIVAWQPTPARRALFAFLYGTGVEISVALRLTRADVNPAAREVRAPGTKAHTRDRVVRVDDWAWDAFWSYARDLLPAAPLFPGVDRYAATDWHRQTVGDGVKDTHGAIAHAGLQLPKRIKMYAARHAWAVRWLRAGVPVEVVQRQLGHITAKETLDTYGRFAPDGADRGHWAGVVAEAEQRRRDAADADHQRKEAK